MYYPGEAALGLLMLYDLDRDDRWFHGAAKALAYLAEVRKGETDVPADHWALLATAKLLSLGSVDIAPEMRARLIRHAVQICTAILAHQVVDPDVMADFDMSTARTDVWITSSRF